MEVWSLSTLQGSLPCEAINSHSLACKRATSEETTKCDPIVCLRLIAPLPRPIRYFKRKVFLDIGYGKSSITVFEDKRILYFNILPVGGKHITNDIASLLKINSEEAENFKKSLNMSETTFVDKINKDGEINSKDFINQIIDNGIMDKEIAYKDGKYTYIINVHPYINIKDEDE